MKQEQGKKMTFDKTVKNKTMEDLVFKDIAKESHLKTDENGIISEKEIPLIGLETSSRKSAEDRNIESWVEYNKSVIDLDKRYSEGIELLNGDILVRLFKKPIVDKYGFAKQNNCRAELRNGAFKVLPDKLAFNFIGVIVNTDKMLESKFPQGTIVQVSPEMTTTNVFAEEFQVLRNGYFRDGDEDKNFSQLGYILIKQGQVLSKILDFSIEEYVKIQEIATLKPSSGIIV